MSSATYDRQGTALTVKPEGRLDTIYSPTLEKEVLRHLDDVQELIMDFEKVLYISSSGIRMLLNLSRNMENSGGNMKVIHVNDYISEIFDMVRFSDLVEVEEN